MDFLNRLSRYFIVVVETGSLLRASKQLRVGQPALSLAMAQLENEIGVKLFMKDGRSLALTAQGQKFAHALREGDKFLSTRAGRALSDPENHVVRFGMVGHWAKKILISELPQINLEFGPLQAHFGYSMKIFEQVRAGELDFGIVTWAYREPRWANCTLLGVDPTAIVGLKSKFGHIREATTIDDLRNEPWIWHRMPQKNLGDYYRPGDKGILVDDYELMRELLFSGQGIADVQIESFSRLELAKLARTSVSVHPQGAKTRIYLLQNDGLEERHINLINLLKKKIQESL